MMQYHSFDDDSYSIDIDINPSRSLHPCVKRRMCACQPRDNEVSALIYYKVHYKQLFIVSACLLIRRLDSRLLHVSGSRVGEV